MSLNVFVFLVLNTILGVTLPKAQTSKATMWILVGFAGYQVAIEIVLQTYECFLIKTGNACNYP